jgi:hypothetical protein
VNESPASGSSFSFLGTQPRNGQLDQPYTVPSRSLALVQRHADPLVKSIGLEQAAAIAREGLPGRLRPRELGSAPALPVLRVPGTAREPELKDRQLDAR